MTAPVPNADRRRERIRRYRQRERLAGIDPKDEAAHWLRENDPEQQSSRKGKKRKR